jgi:hypothetical protein
MQRFHTIPVKQHPPNFIQSFNLHVLGLLLSCCTVGSLGKVDGKGRGDKNMTCACCAGSAGCLRDLGFCESDTQGPRNGQGRDGCDVAQTWA